MRGTIGTTVGNDARLYEVRVVPMARTAGRSERPWPGGTARTPREHAESAGQPLACTRLSSHALLQRATPCAACTALTVTLGVHHGHGAARLPLCTPATRVS